MHIDCAAVGGCFQGVPQHDQHAAQVQQAAQQSQHVEGISGFDRLDEGVSQSAVGIDRTPHQTLHNPGNPHGRDVNHDADGGNPEVRFNGFDAVHLFLTEQTGNEVVHGAHGDQAHPTQSARVHVTHSPVGVVRQSIDCFDGHHGAFEGRHTVEGQGHNEETQHGVVAQLVPCARQGHDTIDHAAPARCQQNEGEHHADGLCPVGQCGVVQVVRTRPHVGKYECPEVNNRQAVAVNRTLCLLRDEVIHHAQEAGGQEEAHSIVSVPPLHHGVLYTRISRVRLHETHRHGCAIDQVKQSHRNDEGAKEPVGHINVANLACAHRAKEHNGK